MWNKQNTEYSLYLVTDTALCPREKLLDCVEAAIRGGVTMVQLREKEISTRAFYEEAEALKRLTSKYQIPLLINDRLDIALAVDAEGLHIGQSDLPADVARRLLGADKLLGLSAGSVEEAKAAVNDGADYLGVGAVFPTETKQDAKNVGKDMLRAVKEAVSVPVVGIGGIHAENLPDIYGCGADGIAVVSAIMGSSRPETAAQTLRRMVASL